jgi:hypothetical protein
MTCEQVVGYLLEGEGLDFLRESLSWVVQQLMGSGGIGAGRGRARRADAGGAAHAPQRLPGAAVADVGGRARAGDREAQARQLLPVLPRVAPALGAGARLGRAYVAGVSTRKVDQVIESLAGLDAVADRGRPDRVLDGERLEADPAELEGLRRRTSTRS